MHQKKVKFESKQTAITKKKKSTALPLDEIYPPTQFHNHSEYSFGDMLRTKFKYENKQNSSMKINKGQ